MSPFRNGSTTSSPSRKKATKRVLNIFLSSIDVKRVLQEEVRQKPLPFPTHFMTRSSRGGFRGRWHTLTNEEEKSDVPFPGDTLKRGGEFKSNSRHYRESSVLGRLAGVNLLWFCVHLFCNIISWRLILPKYTVCFFLFIMQLLQSLVGIGMAPINSSGGKFTGCDVMDSVQNRGDNCFPYEQLQH